MANLIGAGPVNVDSWFQEHRAEFSPPVCNRLMHKNQLTIMFVGGPNTRKDFHIDQSSEFFFQMRGNMELPTIQNGQRKLVKIRQGQVFLLPSRVQHSPQRIEEGSLGLVIERRRDEGEFDGLRYFVDFDRCDEILWERYFHCADLGQDLVPVVKAFMSSEERASGRPTGANIVTNPATKADTTTQVPDPFSLADWINAHRTQLETDQSPISLFGASHPDKEFGIVVCGPGRDSGRQPPELERWIYNIEGEASVTVDGQSEHALSCGSCLVVGGGQEFLIKRRSGCVQLIVTQDPTGSQRTTAA